VTSLAVQPLDGGGFLLAATSGGPDLLIWACRPDHLPEADSAPTQPAAPEDLAAAFGAPAWQLQQRIHVGTQTQLCADFAAVPGAPGWLLLASGGADNAVRLHVRPPGGEFQLQCKLTGHENWVRSVAFTVAREAQSPAARADGEGGAGAGAGGGSGEDGDGGTAEGQEVLLLASASQDR
jgi:hypothetical protein